MEESKFARMMFVSVQCRISFTQKDVSGIAFYEEQQAFRIVTYDFQVHDRRANIARFGVFYRMASL